MEVVVHDDEELKKLNNARSSSKTDLQDDSSSDEGDTITVRGASLREGEAPSLLSRDAFGLLSQYAAVGLVYGALPATITPFFTYYLNMEGGTTTSARALLTIPWSMKVFIGILSDCVPIFGYRRRPYMAIGWTLASACLFIMAFLPLDDPYFPAPEMRNIRPSELTEAQVTSLHKSAPNSGAKYIALMTMTSIGYLLADVAADAIVVDFAQREPEETRGQTQTAVYAVRTSFNVIAQLITGFGLSSPDYGGHFDFGLSFAQIMLILGSFCVPVIPLTVFFVREPKVQAPDFHQYIQKLWSAIKSKAVYQVLAYSFLSGVFGGFSYVAQDPMTSYWVHASSFNLSISGIIGSGVMVITLLFTGKFGLKWNWRVMQALTTIMIIAIDATCTMIVTWDVFRHQWFWLGLPIVETVPAGVGFIVSTFIVVELSGEGNEGAVYGLLTTVANLGSPFALTLTKIVNAPFHVSNADIMEDTTEVRRDVTITILFSYLMKLLSLAFLPLLPKQKAETQQLKKNGGSSRKMGILTVGYLLFALIYAIATNFASIFQ